MNARSLWLCPHCLREHVNAAGAAICCFKKNQRFYCSDCNMVYTDRDRADRCCTKPVVERPIDREIRERKSYTQVS